MQQILDKKNEYVPSFDGLRFWWIVMIVLSHFFNVFSSTYTTAEFLLNGHFAAEGFFVLSGFLQFRHNADRFAVSNPARSGISSYCRGLRRFSVLNALTMIPFITIAITNRAFDWKYGVIIVLNCLLVQNWFPLKDYSINGISWFLSSIMFIYLIMPLLFKMYVFMRRKVGKEQMAFGFVLLMCSLIALEYWSPVFLYKEPFFNILVFMLGAAVSELSASFKMNKLQTCGLVGILLLVLGYLHTPWTLPNLWDCVICAIVIIFIEKTTCLIFTGKTIRMTGKLSLEIMLIHYPVCCLLYPWLNERYSQSATISVLFLIVLVIFSFLLAYLFSYMKNILHRKQAFLRS